MLAPSITQWAGPHTLQRGDVAINNSGATILVHSSKTIRNPSRAAILNIPALPNSRYCAVAAWKASCALYPAPDTAPAFTIAGGRALSVPVTTAVLRHYHGATGHPDPGSVTLHSLRRNTATAATQQDCTLEEIMRQGTWTSAAVFVYIFLRLMPRHSLQNWECWEDASKDF